MKTTLIAVVCILFGGCLHVPKDVAEETARVDTTKLTVNDIGRSIVVVAKTPTVVVSVGSPPPPGLITTKGDTTVYKGQLNQIVEGGIMVRAPFPQTPDTFKAVGIMAKNIKSIEFPE